MLMAMGVAAAVSVVPATAATRLPRLRKPPRLKAGDVVGLVEPFFVAAGFAMYLNRRVELEAWDIEQEFRRAFTPAAVKGQP